MIDNLAISQNRFTLFLYPDKNVVTMISINKLHSLKLIIAVLFLFPLLTTAACTSKKTASSEKNTRQPEIVKVDVPISVWNSFFTFDKTKIDSCKKLRVFYAETENGPKHTLIVYKDIINGRTKVTTYLPSKIVTRFRNDIVSNELRFSFIRGFKYKDKNRPGYEIVVTRSPGASKNKSDASANELEEPEFTWEEAFEDH